MVTLSADETKLQTTIGVVDIVLQPSNEILVDCSNYKLKKLFGFIGGKFEYKSYSEDDEIQSFMEELCKVDKNDALATNKEIFSMTFKRLNEILANEEFKSFKLMFIKQWKNLGYDSIDISDLSTLFKNFYIQVYRYNFEDARSTKIVYFPLVFLNPNTEVLINFEQKSKEFDKSDFYYPFRIKEFIYDFEQKEISKFILNKNIQIQKAEYTNTYDIDNVKECIDGKIWVKKYGSLSGAGCSYVDKADLDNKGKLIKKIKSEEETYIIPTNTDSLDSYYLSESK